MEDYLNLKIALEKLLKEYPVGSIGYDILTHALIVIEERIELANAEHK